MSALLALTLALAPASDDPKPPSLVGAWTWSWKDGEGATHRHVLEVEGTGTKLAARERLDEQPAVKVTDLKVDGKKVSFTVLRGKVSSTYVGSLTDGETILGDVMVTDEGGQVNKYGWTAKRQAAATP